ncbi:hypothetical protein [Microbacterium sp.]|uniref:hypothetical protein n=1 Tax=Microbacterium sp. TaxID=51671 RepID=UPI0039E4E83B
MDAGRSSARRTRALRGVAAASIATMLAATAHTLSGGGAPPPWLVLAVTALTAPLAVALVGRRRSIVRLAAVVAVAQGGLHLAFAAVGPAELGAIGHVHGGAVLEATAALPGADPMTIGHATAAIVTTAILAWGERMLAALAHGIVRLLGRMPAPTPPPSFTAPATARLDVVPVRVPLLSLTRRGPPVLAR